jgi:pyruvate-formate lyase-activating enzyme
MSDNAFSWLEPTRFCDLDCEYCYQTHDPKSHKTIEEFEREVSGLLKLRQTDAVIIAGGEPLTHPNIIEMVKVASSRAAKTLMLTNGQQLTRKLIHELKSAGLKGFIFHVDKHQNRSGWLGKSEMEINTLRQNLADMVYDEKGLYCGFNITVVPNTLSEVREIIRWVAQNIHKVHNIILIPVRVPKKDEPYDYFSGGDKVNLEELSFVRCKSYRNMAAEEIYKEILTEIPGFRFNSYLGGTLRSTVPKWLFGIIIGSSRKIHGNMGSVSMEILQNVHHFITGRYLSFLNPWMYRNANILFPLALFDAELRKSLWRYIKETVRNPVFLFRPMYIQTIVVMQPLDILMNGEQDLCDGCPNKTLWNGRLISECRMEEHLRYGRTLTIAAKREKRGVCSTSGPLVQSISRR